MPQYLRLPPERLDPDSLQGLLEEYASRDGTDYGARERSLQEKVDSLRQQLADARLLLLYEVESEAWDLVPFDDAESLLNDQ